MQWFDSIGRRQALYGEHRRGKPSVLHTSMQQANRPRGLLLGFLSIFLGAIAVYPPADQTASTAQARGFKPLD